MKNDMELLAINTIRTLSIDAVQKAKSGHPGAPMGLAPVGYTLWQDFLTFNPNDPAWPNRDRFVLSNGHASMLLYSLLHLAQVRQLASDGLSHKPSVSLEDITRFRQLHSKCPGHPEYHLTPGVETTTGPLGQGIANSVGMAMASKWKGAYFNRPGFELFSYRVYALCGDGDLMEGLGSEAASLAGHLGLENLCWIYDNNSITIEGRTDLAFSDNVAKRFEGYGWQVLHVDDANDTEQLRKKFAQFIDANQKPTLIIVNSLIGYGSPKKQDTAKAHGEPLGEEEVRAAKLFYGWDPASQFKIPDGVLEHFESGIKQRGEQAQSKWNTLLSEYEKEFPELAKQFSQMHQRALPVDWEKDLPNFTADLKGIATRVASGKVLNALAKKIPWLIGGSADLAPSTKTLIEGENSGSFSKETRDGRNIHFGIRENAMASVANGLALSNLHPYASTFLTFSDYARPGIRLSALMELPVTYIFTHDSIGVGEDGPTHQPIEHLSSLRAMPGLVVMRPADANEVTHCWIQIMGMPKNPSALILSRQDLPVFDRSKYADASGVKYGAYILADTDNQSDPDVILIATGSEVYLCIEAYEHLKKDGYNVRVVSMPSFELFENQDNAYRKKVFPPHIKARVAVEQASEMGWHKYVGDCGEIIAMTTFGSSAPFSDLQKHFGFTKENIVKAAIRQIANQKRGQQ